MAVIGHWAEGFRHKGILSAGLDPPTLPAPTASMARLDHNRSALRLTDDARRAEAEERARATPFLCSQRPRTAEEALGGTVQRDLVAIARRWVAAGDSRHAARLLRQA